MAAKEKPEKPKWSKRKLCSAKHCKHYQWDNAHLAFHRFPKDQERCARWVHNLRNPSLKEISCQRLHQSYRVCSAHFHPSQFKRPSDVHAGLKWNAVPSLVSGPNSPAPLDVWRKTPSELQELPLKKRKQSYVGHPSNTGSSTADSVQQPAGQWDSIHLVCHRYPKEPDRHAVKWDAVPTKASGLNPSLPEDLVWRRKTSEECHELPLKKRKQSHVVQPLNEGSAAADSVQQPASSETDTTAPDAAVAGPSVQAIPLFSPKSLPAVLEAAAARERAQRLKINSLRSQVCKLKAKVRELNRLKKTSNIGVDKDSVLQQLKKLLPAKTFAFVTTQIRVSLRKAQGFRWTAEDKSFFLSLLRASPKCYKLLLKVFSMPSIRTLQKLMKSTGVKPDFNQNILASMKKTMETKKPVDRVCAIITDEISLKRAVQNNMSADRIEGHAPYVNHASAFMVRGLFGDWKQLFGYCFTNGPIPHTQLQSFLLEAIFELRKAGMECLVFICDQSAANRSMLTRLGVTKEKPYFEVDAVRVFCLWDPPYLIKNICNNWHMRGFTLDGDRILWAILKDLYAYDSKQDKRLCCLLTKKHVNLPPSASTCVKFATQVLSHSVAVGIQTLAQVKQLTGQELKNYMATAKFCEDFDGIFNCFNSKQLKDPHELKSALSDASAHFLFLEKCMEWLPRLKRVGARPGTEQMACVQGWQHNIVCLKMIWGDLRERHQVSHLLTHRLNQDCLQEAFSTIRANVNNHDSPDPVQFECEHQEPEAAGLMSNNSEETNGDQNMPTFVLQLCTQAFQESPLVITDTEQMSTECSISQDSPRITINTKVIMDEHGYAGVTRGDETGPVLVYADSAVTTNLGTKADQVKEPPIH